MKLFNRILLTVPVVAFITSLTYSQIDRNKLTHYNSIADKLIKSALGEEKGYNLLKELNKNGQRLSGSDASMKAINWAKKTMEGLGFDKVWLQKTMVPHWVRGKAESAFISSSLKFKGRKLNIAALGGSSATPKEGITAEILEVKSIEELTAKKDIAKGKIIFFNRPLDRTLVSSFAGYGSAVDQRFGGPVAAAQVGAVGVIIRAVTTKRDNNPHTGVMGTQEGVNVLPAVAAGVLDAEFLTNALKQEPTLKVTIKTDCKLLPDVESFNVIGELKGTDLSNEVIVVGGHFDSWDLGDGSHDDGGPCIQTMEILDLFKRNNIKPKRTIRCIFFINEENGLRGGLEYGRWAETSGEIHIAAMESDRGCFTPRGFYVGTDSTSLKKIQSWLPILNKSLIEWIKPGGGGSDIAPIRKAKAQIGYVPDDQRYMDLHHSANDVYSEVHPREMELGASAMAILVFLLSEEGL